MRKIGLMAMIVAGVLSLVGCGGTSVTANSAPEANAGVDRSVEVNVAVDLNGSASDSDGQVVSVEWKEDGNVIATALNFSYIPTSEGNHTLTLEVMDDDGAVDTDEVLVQATPPAVSSPTILLADQTVDDNGGGLATDLPAPTVTDVQANATYSIVGTPPTGLTINSSTGVMTYDNDLDANTDYNVTIKVINPDGGFAQITFTLTVINNL